MTEDNNWADKLSFFRRGPDAAADGEGLQRNFTMKVQARGDTLTITGVKELGAANSQSFRDQARAAFTDQQKHIEIDLSQTMFVDSCGLGALISLHKSTASRNGVVRLLNPTPPVQQILELTRMHRIFEIVAPRSA